MRTIRSRQALSIHEGSPHRCCSLRRPARQEGRSIDRYSRRCARRRGCPAAVFVAGRIAAPDWRSKFRRRSGPGGGREPLTGRGDSGSVHAARSGRRFRFAANRRRPAAYLDAAVSAPEDPVSAACRRDGQDDEKVVSLAGSMADARTAPFDSAALRRARRLDLHPPGRTRSPSRIRPLSNECSYDHCCHIRAGTVGQKRVPHGARLCCKSRRRLFGLPASDVVRPVA